MLLALWACGGGKSDPVCDQYVSCAGAFTASFAAEAQARYERDGSCFQAYEVEECSAECEGLMVEAWTFSTEPRCDPSTVGIDVMSEGEFLQGFTDLFCATWAACTGEADICADIETVLGGCDYRPEHARECLQPPWVCDDRSFPLVPDICDQACT